MGLPGKADLTSRDIREVVMQAAEPVSSREATNRLLKILDSIYEKADIEYVAANATHLEYEERTQLLRLLKDFEDLFDGTIGDWDIEPVNLELNPNYKMFNCKYYLVPIINKDTFCKYLYLLMKIGVLTLVQQSQYGTPVFIIPKKEGITRFITDYSRLN